MTKQQILQAGELTANFPADAKTIIGLELAENANGDPVARIVEQRGIMREWELTDAPHVSVFNEFLRRLDLGVEIEFKSFPQYAELLMKCCELVRERHAENTSRKWSFTTQQTIGAAKWAKLLCCSARRSDTPKTRISRKHNVRNSTTS
jgi:hypothetical protein